MRAEYNVTDNDITSNTVFSWAELRKYSRGHENERRTILNSNENLVISTESESSPNGRSMNNNSVLFHRQGPDLSIMSHSDESGADASLGRDVPTTTAVYGRMVFNAPATNPNTKLSGIRRLALANNAYDVEQRNQMRLRKRRRNKERKLRRNHRKRRNRLRKKERKS